MSKLNRFWTDKVFQTRDQRPLIGGALVQPWTMADFRTVFARAYSYQKTVDASAASGKTLNNGKGAATNSRPANAFHGNGQPTSRNASPRITRESDLPPINAFSQSAPPQANLQQQRNGPPQVGWTKPPEQKPTSPCRLCKKDHWTNECTTYTTLHQRIQQAAKLQLCIHCLGIRHFAKNCQRRKPCYSCRGPQHQVFCPNREQRTTASNVYDTAALREMLDGPNSEVPAFDDNNNNFVGYLTVNTAMDSHNDNNNRQADTAEEMLLMITAPPVAEGDSLEEMARLIYGNTTCPAARELAANPSSNKSPKSALKQQLNRGPTPTSRCGQP
jgi:hypothetical protein